MAKDCGTHKSGAGEVHGKVQADGGDTGNYPSAAADEAGARGRHGARPAQMGGKESGGGKVTEKSQECWATTGAVMPPEWPTSPLEWGKRRGAASHQKWQKTHGGTAREWAGESSFHRATTSPELLICPRGTKPLE